VAAPATGCTGASACSGKVRTRTVIRVKRGC
jgi:hypothetical protein